MGQHKSYEESIKDVYKGLLLLGAVTLVEVGISLFGKGHLGYEPGTILIVAVAVGLIVLSVYKAYFIIYEFMHMGYEVSGLRMSVLLPTALLIWALVAFFQEGNFWKKRREQIKEKNKIEKVETQEQGSLFYDKPHEVYHLS
ncbi:MAG: cytochrome C oxidase subunit IV family protein [Bacteroidota bacterium]